MTDKTGDRNGKDTSGSGKTVTQRKDAQQETAQRKTASGKAASDKTTSDKTTPGKTTSGRTTPDKTASDRRTQRRKARPARKVPETAVEAPQGATLPGQERYVAPVDKTPLQAVDSMDESQPATSMWAEAWRTLRRNPLFIVSAILIILVLLVAIFPGLFTKGDPNYCDLEHSLDPAESGHPFGYDLQGCDVYTRTIYGTRASLEVGVLTTILVVIVGGLIGAIAGYFGGWVDSVLSEITNIFYAIPLLLGAIVVLQMFRTSESIWKVVFVLALFGWVSVARITRSAVMEAKNLEFNTASRALGSSRMRNLFHHVIPNSLAPVIVVATTSLGTYIVSEATLSFLGIGLPSTVVSWGGDISAAQNLLRVDPAVLFWPSLALAITVLAFIMMGDAVRDALDPKSRTR